MPGLRRQCFAFKRRLRRPFFRIRYFNSLNVSLEQRPRTVIYILSFLLQLLGQNYLDLKNVLCKRVRREKKGKHAILIEILEKNYFNTFYRA